MVIKLIEFQDVPQHVNLMLSRDPHYLGRVTLHLQKLRQKQLQQSTPIQEAEETVWEIEYYSAVLAEVMKQQSQITTKDEAFEQADINAQKDYDEQTKPTL